jgi:hypothetical protein
MELRKKLREQENERPVMMMLSRRAQTFTNQADNSLTNVVEDSYTTNSRRRFSGKRAVAARAAADQGSIRLRRAAGNKMAFVRRKGNAYYLVHNVRRDGKVQQLHLAKLGERARITDEVVREVSKKHPFVELNWRELREQLDSQIDLADPQSPAVQNLVHSLRNLNLDLADLFPPVVRFSESPALARELLVQLRLLHSTIQVKLNQFGHKDELKRMQRSGGRFGNAWRGQ